MSAALVRAWLGFALAFVAASAQSTEWSGEAVARYGGVYSTDCGKASAPRLRAEPGALSVQVGDRRMTGTHVEISLAPFGNQVLDPGKEIVVLISEVRGTHGLSFWVHRDASGQHVELEADPAVTSALGKALVASRFQDCDAERSRRAAAEATAAIERAREEAAASKARPDKSGFRAAYLRALGPLAAQEEWLVNEVPRPTDDGAVTLAGTRYRQLTGCKPHDCADNNALVLFSPQTRAVYGKVLVRQVPRYIGAPPAAIAAELDRLWRAEWRQGR